MILTSKIRWPGRGPLPNCWVGDTSGPVRAHVPPTWPGVCPEVLWTPTPTEGMAPHWAGGWCTCCPPPWGTWPDITQNLMLISIHFLTLAILIMSNYASQNLTLFLILMTWFLTLNVKVFFDINHHPHENDLLILISSAKLALQSVSQNREMVWTA